MAGPASSVACAIHLDFMVSAIVGDPPALFPGLPVFLLFYVGRVTGLSGGVVGFVLFPLTRDMTDCQAVVYDAAGGHCVAGLPVRPAFAIMGMASLATTSFWLIVRPRSLPPL